MNDERITEQLEALRLIPGEVYAIECSEINASQAVRDAYREALEGVQQKLGVKFVLLGPHLQIARADALIIPKWLARWIVRTK